MAQSPIVTVPIQYREKIVEKLVPMVNPADSANFLALFECDANNQVIMKELREEKSKHVESQYTFNQGKLKYNAKTNPDTIYLPSKEITIEREIPVRVEVPGPITNILTWWQKTQVYAGRVLLGFILALGIYKALKFKSII
ncbi:MAG: hypothetical protein NTX38_00075 [Methylobacter sp.]|nr:hypothetical protein [Methylobacter sp.]